MMGRLVRHAGVLALALATVVPGAATAAWTQTTLTTTTHFDEPSLAIDAGGSSHSPTSGTATSRASTTRPTPAVTGRRRD